jgi:hypothetical protein
MIDANLVTIERSSAVGARDVDEMSEIQRV